MARVFRQLWTRTLANGRKLRRESRKWYVEHRDADGIVRRVPGFTDRKATEQLGADLERRAARQQVGFIDRFAEHRKRPLAEHVGEWRAALTAKGNTAKHADLSASRVRRVLGGCNVTYWSDLSADKAQAYLAALRRDGLSVSSSNHLLQAVKGFCRWPVRDGRAADTPLAHLQGGNVKTDRRHDRRALEADELRRVAVRSGSASKASACSPIRVWV